ncbi:MAG: ATP-binding protein, partial [Bacteroidota bacterium]
MNLLTIGKKIAFWAFSFGMLLVQVNLYSQSTCFLRSTDDVIDLNPHLSITEESEKGFSLEEAIQWKDYSSFASSYTLSPNKAYWGKVHLTNSLAYQVNWIFSPDWGKAIEHNGNVDVYLQYTDSLVTKKSGRFIPASQKDIPEGPDNYVSITLAAGQEVEVFFRIEKINHVAPVCNVKLVEKNRWEALSQGKRYIFEGIVQGMLWMMILYSFIIFLGTKERSYLIYTLFLLSSSIYFLYLSGILLEVFLYEVPKLNTFVRIIVSNLVPWAFFQISRSFVDTATLIPKWDKAGEYLLRGIIVWMCIEFIINLIWFHEPILNFMVNSAFMLEGLFLLAIIIRYFFTPYTIARIFIYGSICMVLAAFVGVGADVFLNIQAMLPIVEGAFIAQVLTFALGLAYRLRMGEREKLEAQKLLNERLIQTDHLKDTFLANTSHELRTPLTGILGLSENLYEKYEKISSQNAQKDLSMIITSAKRLTSLVNDILDFSKLKTRDLNLQKKAIDLHSLVDVVLHTNRPLVIGKEISLENGIPEEIPLVLGDENRLQQIFYNLIGNAIKFTEKGYIRISAEEKKGFVHIQVSDTGTGIPEHKRDAIFQEFEQADGSIRREFAGTGLGLSISKKLVELHGGEIWVESEVSVGSTFFITLPVAPAGLKPETGKTITPLVQINSNGNERAPTTIEITDTQKGIRILIVDDEVINHHVLKNHLGENTYEKVSAMNGEEALGILEKEKPFDLVLLDLMMPRMSGYEVCEEIRKKYLPSELPVIMITAK